MMYHRQSLIKLKSQASLSTIQIWYTNLMKKNGCSNAHAASVNICLIEDQTSTDDDKAKAVMKQILMFPQSNFRAPVTNPKQSN